MCQYVCVYSILKKQGTYLIEMHEGASVGIGSSSSFTLLKWREDIGRSMGGNDTRVKTEWWVGRFLGYKEKSHYLTKVHMWMFINVFVYFSYDLILVHLSVAVIMLNVINNLCCLLPVYPVYFLKPVDEWMLQETWKNWPNSI